MTHPDPILAKVRKLLALAEDPAATEHEAVTYTAKAAQLIADYGIDQVLLAQADPTRDPVGDRVLTMDAPYAADKADLLSTVAGRLRCQTVQRTRWRDGRKELSLHLFGHHCDLERTELLFTSLLLQAATGLSRTHVPPGEHKAAFRRSWLAGFRMAIGDRLKAAEQRARAESSDRFREAGSSTELVLADRSALVEAALNQAYPYLTTAPPRQLSGSGGAEGWAAGRRADLGERRVGSARRALPRGA
ncbi:DUF2786 domain-containing protein [Nocardioides panaciterrulae]|uniref:Ribosome modulation factor n=1 Tax=Nocardioides panaciterrulae TaxID=661492 RepID=A0A7Y9E461_9ACTN|nr:DUF2786 domain-containing protein [Nocardioides panaciterrulae]NYD40724.1 ribosome modulation factor [Nocardioides panaciterrulae]